MRRYGLYVADLHRGSTDSHGTINYALGLARALPAQLHSDERLVIFANRDIVEELGTVDTEIVVLRGGNSTPRRLLLDHITSQTAAVRHRIDVLLYPKGFVPALRLRRGGVAATLHDDIAFSYSRGDFGKDGRGYKGRYFAWAFVHSMRRANHLLTDSKFTLSRLHQRATALGVDLPPTTVTYVGIPVPDVPYVPLANRRRAIVHIGSPLPHKRSDRAISWTLAFMATKAPEYHLLVTGRLTDEVETLCRIPHVQRLMGFTSANDLSHLLAESRALVFTSEYEGFGLPPVEATSVGTPAVYANLTSVPEVMAGFPAPFEATSYESFADAFNRALLLDDSELQRNKTDIRCRYTWSNVAHQVITVLRSLAANRRKFTCSRRQLDERPAPGRMSEAQE